MLVAQVRRVAGRHPARDPDFRMPSAPILERIVELLDDRFGLDSLLLFGSAARREMHRESDLDLAGLFRRRPTALELLDAQTDVEAIVGRGVDLVDLATVSPILARQVLRDGRCLFGANAPALASFESMLPSRYADLKRVRAEAERALVERVAHDRP